MTSKHDAQTPDTIHDGVSADIDLTDLEYVQFGRNSGPPRSRTISSTPKQWQSPKNESTPSNRPKKE